MADIEFRELADRVAAEAFPDQQKFWRVNRRAILERVENAQSLAPEQTDDLSDFHFSAGGLIEVIQTGIAVTGQVAQLVSAIVVIYGVVRTRQGQRLNANQANTLAGLLDKFGVAADKAAKILELLNGTTKG